MQAAAKYLHSLKTTQNKLRRRTTLFWLTTAILMAAGFLSSWAVTGDRRDLWSLFYVLIPLAGWIHARFWLLPLAIDPLELNAQLRRRDRNASLGAKNVSVQNGQLLATGSPFIPVIAIFVGYSDGGWPLAFVVALAGLLMGGAWGVAIWWGRR